MKRREFIVGAAAAPLVFGLRDLFAQDAAEPKWWQAAKLRMKSTTRCGLVLVSPDGDVGRQEMGRLLFDLVRGKDEDVHVILAEAVVICLRPEFANKFVRAADEKANCYVLDADSKRLAACEIAIEQLRKPADFVAAARKALHGADGKLLREAVERTKRALSEADRTAVARAIEILDVEGDVAAETGLALARHADRIAPWLAFASLDAVYKLGRERLRLPLVALYSAATEAEAGSKLPYGTRAIEAAEAGEGGGCPACGMARVEVRSILDFLAE